MKKIIALAVALFATQAFANVASSPHNLANGLVNGPGVCQYCHMPHNANSAVSGLAPIWARSLSSTALLTAYVFTGRSPVPTIDLNYSKNSLLCLSCHDGNTSLATLYTGATLVTGNYLIPPVVGIGQGVIRAGRTRIGPDLRNDHPVGVQYPLNATAPSQAGLVARLTAQNNGFVFFGAGNDYLECGSCHEPHLWSSVTTDPTYKFKRQIGAGLDFCAACHANK